jgi:hypothetical protein
MRFQPLNVRTLYVRKEDVRKTWISGLGRAL